MHPHFFTPTAAVRRERSLHVFQNKDQKVVKARSRYTPRAFEAAFRQLDKGIPIETVCQHLGVARSTFYRWKARFAADVDLQQWLADQNQRLQESVRKLAADKALLQLILRRGN